jgi:hypothetical protein
MRIVTRRGRLAGIFLPTPRDTLPIALKRELFPVLSAHIRRQMRRRRLSERDVEAAFVSWQSAKAAGSEVVDVRPRHRRRRT